MKSRIKHKVWYSNTLGQYISDTWQHKPTVTWLRRVAKPSGWTDYYIKRFRRQEIRNFRKATKNKVHHED